MKNWFFKTLPENYTAIYRINAKDSRTGLILNFFALLLSVAVFVPLTFIVNLSPLLKDLSKLSATLFVGLAGVLLYMVLHELLHGLAYKLTTKQKLTFGISWSCAFCGVPDIYVTRKTALIALMTPFVVFTIVFIIALILSISNPFVFAVIGFVFAMHVGGCAGDLYVFFLLTFKYKNKLLLMQDTGPEQTFYLQEK